MLNASARNTQIFIGDKDFSSCLISFQGSDSHLDQSGLIAFTGSITLGRSLLFDEPLDDRKNPRFFRGQFITIDILDSQGNFRRHPRGTLRIISPKYNDESNRLTIDVGDLIALLNFREPIDSTKAEIKLGDSLTSGAIILRLLSAAGITAVSGALPSTIINYPINVTGSYLSNVGKILYANNLFGWIDNNEVFQICQADIAATQPAITVRVGRDEIWYKRLDAAESPCEIVKACGRETIVRPTAFRDDTSEQYGSALLVDKDASNYPIIIKKTITKEKWFPERKTLETITTTYQPAGLVIPKELIKTTSKLSLIQSELRKEITKYEQSNEGKLKQKTIVAHQLLAPAIFEYVQAKKNSFYFNIFSLAESINALYSYEYDSKDRLVKITSTTSEIAGNLLTGTNEDWTKWIFPPEFLTQTEHKVEEWTEPNKDIWDYEFYSYQPLIKVKPDLAEVGTETGTRGPTSNKLDALYADGSHQTSNSGQLAPPAPERQPSEFTSEEEDREEKATFAVAGNSGLRPRERTFSVDFLAGRFRPKLKRGEVQISLQGTSSNNQLKAIAQREGRLLLGRYKGQQIAVSLTDEWFEYHPLFSISAIEQDGLEQAFLADGCSWVVGQTRVLVSCDAIWLGSWKSVPTAGSSQANKVVIPPYTEIEELSLGCGSGIAFKGFQYPLIPILNSAQLGIGLNAGAWVGTRTATNSATWSDFDWDTVDWDSLADESMTWDLVYWDMVDWDN